MTTTPHTATLGAADLTELLDLGSATAYEASGYDCALPAEFRPAWPGARCIGTALPVAAAPGDNLPLHWALESARPGDVLVVDAGGSEHGYWGEVLTVSALARGVAGLVIDGGVRDTEALRRLGFPAFSTSICIRGTHKEWPGRVGEPVHLRGHRVERGDLVVADTDGVAVLPRADAAAVLVSARDRAAKEETFMNLLRGGALTLDLYNLRPIGDPYLQEA